MTAKQVLSLNNYFEILILCIFIALYPIDSFKYSDVDLNNFEKPDIFQKTELKTDDCYPKLMMSENLWEYLRRGLNYLEASGKEYPPDFVHPGGVAFGPLGLSKVAVEDVFERFPEMAGFNADEVFKDPKIYENFAECYADLLLRHYLKLDYWNMPAEEVFNILQRAWFLGPTIYKNGGQVIASRQIRAKEFVMSNNKLAM